MSLAGAYEIILENLVIEAIIGILPSERMRAQRVEICLEITYHRASENGIENASANFCVDSGIASSVDSGAESSRADKHSELDTAHRHSEQSSQSQFLDYALVRDMLVEHLQESQYGLLEDALDGSIAMLKASFPTITHITLTLKKPDILAPCCVGMRKSTAFVG